jgi:dTDP-4-amino-4,6-dideoxygalactose transaminase
MIGVGTFSVNDKMRELVNVVLDTGRISYGPMSRVLESRFAAIHERRHGVLSNSGTSSLQVALQAMKEIHGWADGDEVIVPSVTFVATPNIVLHNNMKPVLVDIEPDYYGIDITKIEAAITPRTRAIIPVHLFGMPCNMARVVEIACHHGLKIIEDSCETMFVKHHGRMTGAWSDIGCFSMYVAHLLTAGVGGIAITNDPGYAVKMRSLVNHGRDGIYISIDDDDGLENSALREVMERRFHFETVGHSYRITELEAALALGQLDDWEGMIAARQERAAYLTDRLRPLSEFIQLPALRPGTDHAFMMYPIVVRDGSKWPLCQHLEKHDIETREMLRLTDQPAYRGLWNPGDYSVAEWINESGFYIGVHQNLSLEDMETIVEVFYTYWQDHA